MTRHQSGSAGPTVTGAGVEKTGIAGPKEGARREKKADENGDDDDGRDDIVVVVVVVAVVAVRKIEKANEKHWKSPRKLKRFKLISERLSSGESE